TIVNLGWIGRIVLHTFENTGATHPRHTYGNHEIACHAVSKRHHPAFDRTEAVNVVPDIGKQGRVAELIEPDVFDESGCGELALVESPGADGGDPAATADAANARMMRDRKSTRLNSSH